jgi:hypothetical protein
MSIFRDLNTEAHGEVKEHIQGHMADNWQSWSMTPSLCNLLSKNSRLAFPVSLILPKFSLWYPLLCSIIFHFYVCIYDLSLHLECDP